MATGVTAWHVRLTMPAAHVAAATVCDMHSGKAPPSSGCYAIPRRALRRGAHLDLLGKSCTMLRKQCGARVAIPLGKNTLEDDDASR